MQNLESLISNLGTLTTTILYEPGASAAIGALIGALIVVLLSTILQQKHQKKIIQLQQDADRRLHSLQRTLTLKNRQVATMEQTSQEQKEALKSANEYISQLEVSAKNTPLLEEKVEQQLRQIEALTETIESEFDFNESAIQDSESTLPREAEDTLPNHGVVIDHLTASLHQKLSTLHQHIAEQSQLITTLQSELDIKKESVAQQIIAKSQNLPKMAKTSFDEKVIEPIHTRVDGFKQTVQAIPDQTRAKIDTLVMTPINHRIGEIKAGLSQIPIHTASQLNKVVVDPLNEFIHQVNQKVTNASVMTQEKFDALITTRLQDLIDQFKMTSRSLTRDARENLNRIIVQPLENLLEEITKKMQAMPKQTGDRFSQFIVQPTVHTLSAITKSGKNASIKGIKNAGNWVVDSVSGSSAPAAAT